MIPGITKRLRKMFWSQCAILLYHRVTDLKTDPQSLAVSPGNFDIHLRYLKKNYTLLEIDEFFGLLSQRKKYPRNSVILTFDDGYMDNLKEALPLLVTHKSQSLFYISTGNIGTDREFWWDELERFLLLSQEAREELSVNISGELFKFSTKDPDERRRTYEQLLPILRKQNPDERIRVMDEIYQWSGKIPPRESYRTMTREEVREMALSPHAVIGAHTCHHQSLASLPADLQKQEIISSKHMLEEITGKKVVHFSYPFGTKKDYNPETIRICKEAGFEYVCANYPDSADITSSHWELPRFLVRNWNEREFSENLKTFFAS